VAGLGDAQNALALAAFINGGDDDGSGDA